MMKATEQVLFLLSRTKICTDYAGYSMRDSYVIVWILYGNSMGCMDAYGLYGLYGYMYGLV